MHIAGKTILVSGASSGIGAALAREAARQGAQVLLLARRQDALMNLADDIRAAGGQARVYPVDLANSRHIEETARLVREEAGRPDVIVNNAGIGRWVPLEETPSDEIAAMMALPYFAAANLTREFLPSMRVRNSGCIVNVTSIAAYLALPDATAYTSARWAMRGFTEALRADLYGTGIRVMQFASSTVKTPYFEQNASVSRVPRASRLLPELTPEQVARGILGGVSTGSRDVFMPAGMRFLIAMQRFFPQTIERAFRSGAKQQESSRPASPASS